jgi:transcriptional regulator with XRE-family HTH domain
MKRGKEVDLKKIVAARLAQARTEAGYTQTEVKNLLGYRSTGTVSGHEDGTSIPRPEELYKLAKLYGCTMDWLMGDSSHKTLTRKEESELTPEEIRYLAAFRSASELDRSVALRILESSKISERERPG